MSVQNAQKTIFEQYIDKIGLEYRQKLSTLKSARNRTKPIYTPSYAHYPQKFSEEKCLPRRRTQERPFCVVVIKIHFSIKKCIFLLTNAMSKISKKFVKLLQNQMKIWYNAYTIKNRRGWSYEVYHFRKRH